MENSPVIEARGLSIEYAIQKQWLNAIADVDLQIRPLEIHGLVGESGSGKSTLGLGLMRYLAPNARITAGQILFEGDDLVTKTDAEMQAIWGSQISLVPQNPLDSLNPSMTIGAQMTEVTRLHMNLSKQAAAEHAVEALDSVKIADPGAIMTRYPHQLSGGMQQRVMIAMALSTRPRLLILDEPTTALDVTTQAVILDLVRELIRQEGAAALYVSHDLGTVAQLCDSVSVLYGGEVVEHASVSELYRQPLNPYTAGLLASLPSAASGSESRLSTIAGVAPSMAERSAACVFAPRCPVAIERCHSDKPPLEHADDARLVRCWRWEAVASGEIIPRNPSQGKVSPADVMPGYVLEGDGISKRFGEHTLLDRLTGQPPRYVQAVDDVSIQIKRRSTLGLVGESGSGKTTLARAIVALHSADDGELHLLDAPLSRHLNKRQRDQLRNLQMIFQNPHDALNPFQTVGQTLTRTIRTLADDRPDREAIRQRVNHLLDAVGLTAAYADRYPGQLSGGEKQRIAIARAFATNPALVIADEPTSSLDVSVQAVILNLLKDLRAEEGASYLLISHDLEVISYLADWILVMYLGEIVEEGSTEAVYEAPWHPYTEALLSAVPIADPDTNRRTIRLEGDIPSPRDKPSGCPFHTRCPRKIGAICESDTPPMRDAGEGHRIRCHIPIDELIQAQQSSSEDMV